jgi:hypothetical protein
MYTASEWNSLSHAQQYALIVDKINGILYDTRGFLKRENQMPRGRCTTGRGATPTPSRPWDRIFQFAEMAPWTKELMIVVCKKSSSICYDIAEAVAKRYSHDNTEGRATLVDEYKYLIFESVLLRRLADGLAGYVDHIDHLVHITVDRRWLLLIEATKHKDMATDWSKWAASLECCQGKHRKLVSQLGAENESQMSQELQEQVVNSAVQETEQAEVPSEASSEHSYESEEHAVSSDTEMMGMD